MKPHELRVVDEKKELDEKIVKLTEFFRTKTFAYLDSADRHLMLEQRSFMIDYSDALGKRIARFKL